MHGDRKTTIDDIIHNEKKKVIPYPEKEDAINTLREKIKIEDKAKKSDNDKIIDKFKTRGSIAKSERTTVVADYMHMGEKIPFCADAKKKEGETADPEKKGKKFTYNTVYPQVIYFYFFFFINYL